MPKWGWKKNNTISNKNINLIPLISFKENLLFYIPVEEIRIPTIRVFICINRKLLYNSRNN